MKRYKLAPIDTVGSSLRDRIAMTRATADKVLRRPLNSTVARQPQEESLTRGASVEDASCLFRESGYPNQHGQPELARNLDRTGAEGGAGGSAETVMGRHETFENASPLANELLASTLLRAQQAMVVGSRSSDPIIAAIDANRTAEAEIDAFYVRIEGQTMEAVLRAEEQRLSKAQTHSWATVYGTIPTTREGLSALRAWLAWQIERHNEPAGGDHSVWADSYLALTRALDGLNASQTGFSTPEDIAVRVPEPDLSARAGHPCEFADQFDFSAFSVGEIARLSEAARMISDMWMHFSNAPYCYADCDRTARPIWGAYDFECSRMGFLRDRCVEELGKRLPESRWERDEILSIRLAHELACNDSIAEPGLLAEAVKAWG